MKSLSPSWKEGKYADLWSLVHFLSGMVGGTGLLLVGIPEAYAWATAVTLTIAWEIYEWKTGMGEDMQNVLADIALGIGGGATGYLYVRHLGLGIGTIAAIFIIEVLLLNFLARTGWRNYRKYGK
jgi:hypothetical protein